MATSSRRKPPHVSLPSLMVFYREFPADLCASDKASSKCQPCICNIIAVAFLRFGLGASIVVSMFALSSYERWPFGTDEDSAVVALGRVSVAMKHAYRFSGNVLGDTVGHIRQGSCLFSANCILLYRITVVWHGISSVMHPFSAFPLMAYPYYSCRQVMASSRPTTLVKLLLSYLPFLECECLRAP